MNNYKNYFNKIFSESYNIALSKEIGIPPIYEPKVTEDTQETSSDEGNLKYSKVFMGLLSEILFPLCLADYFVSKETSNEDILNALNHICLTKENVFTIFDSEVNDSNSLFLSKSEDFKARILASRQESKKETPQGPSIKEYSESKSEELFKHLGIDSEVTSLKTKILSHFLHYKDSDDTSKFTYEGKEDTEKYEIIYLAHLYRSKQHANEGQKEIDAIRWYKQRSHGIAHELEKPELAFADTKVIKAGRGGISVAIRLIIIPKNNLNESINKNPISFEIEDSNDSVRIMLSLNYHVGFLDDLEKVLGNPNNVLFGQVVSMIQTYLDNIQKIPEINESREYLEFLTSNGEVDYIDLQIRSTGELGGSGGQGGGELGGNIKKDADIKIVEFESMTRKGIKNSKTFNFSLKASDRKDVGTIQFTNKWKTEMEWIFKLCDLDFNQLQWDENIANGDSDTVMNNMKKYFISIQSTSNEKLIKFMFSMLDLFAHGHEGSTVVAISQSKNDIKIYSNVISEYIRSRDIYVSVLDMNDPQNVKTYYDRIEKRKGETKKGRKPSLDINQFLLQLTDNSNDSFGVFKLIQAHSRRSSKMDEGRKAEEFAFNPYKIAIDDELDDLCKKLSGDLKDDRRKKFWSINRIFRRLFLIESLITKNKNNKGLLNQYKEVVESFESILSFYGKIKELHSDRIDYNLIEEIKKIPTHILSKAYSGDYEPINKFMFDSGPLSPESEEKLKTFYGTAIAYSRQKCQTLIKQIEGGTYQ